MTTIRALRLFSDASLDDIAGHLSIAPSRLSVIERHGHNLRVGRTIRKRIERYFGLPFGKLITPIDSDQIAAVLRQLAA